MSKHNFAETKRIIEDAYLTEFEHFGFGILAASVNGNLVHFKTEIDGRLIAADIDKLLKQQRLLMVKYASKKVEERLNKRHGGFTPEEVHLIDGSSVLIDQIERDSTNSVHYYKIANPVRWITCDSVKPGD